MGPWHDHGSHALMPAAVAITGSTQDLDSEYPVIEGEGAHEVPLELTQRSKGKLRIAEREEVVVFREVTTGEFLCCSEYRHTQAHISSPD